MKPSSHSSIPSDGSHHTQPKKPAARPAVPVNLDVRAYFAEGAPDNSQPWLLNPEIPSPDEIMGTGSETESVDLLPNRIVGPWSSKNEYLKAHYELLREDAVAPLRDAVAYFREDPDIQDMNIVSIYEKVCTYFPLRFSGGSSDLLAIGTHCRYYLCTTRCSDSDTVFHH